jgi:3-hydroxyisobutyrate dehydrogenase
MRVGIAGLGRMGGAVAARLLDVGREVTVWNRSAEKTKPLAAAGATVAASPADLASKVDAVITMLTDHDAMLAVYSGPSGLLAADVTGKVFIEMSTVQPESEIALAGRVRDKGGLFIECPVGGTVGPARQGRLLGVVGGRPEDVAKAWPLLEQLCRRVEHVGPVGAGASLKLTLNLPLLVYYQALGEALVLCRHLNLDPKWLIEFLSDTSGGPNVLKTRGPGIAAALTGGDPGPTTFDVDLICKDLRTMIAEAGARGATLPLVGQALAIYEEARGEGWGKRDGAWLPAYWPKRNPPR